MMLFSARNGSAYSKNFLISLYKVYYKSEYNKVKRLKLLTYLNILEFHDEECYRKGLPSGHTVDGQKSFKQMIIERRMHEPGWTNAYGTRNISPISGKNCEDSPNAEKLNAAAKIMREMGDAPDEPPLQPAAARLLIMAQLLGIEIEDTCNEIAANMNDIVDGMNQIMHLNSPEYRKIRDELVERCSGMIKANYPEMFDPYDYQRNEHYLGLQAAE
jgi:hypothetical protein